MSMNYDCLPAIAFTLLPNFGFFVLVDLTSDNDQWYSSLEHPNWGVSTGVVYFPLLLTANLLQGYASFLTWEIEEQNWMSLPMLVYGANLFFLWVHFPIFLGCKSLWWGAVDISLTLASAVWTTYLFYTRYDAAGYLMIPYLCMVIYDSCRDFWMYLKNKETKRRDDSVLY